MTPKQAQPVTGQERPLGVPVDLVREAGALLLLVSLPGARTGDFRISLVGDRQVYIEGTAPYRHPVPKEALQLAERPYGPFQRTVQLPLPVSASGASVTLRDGVLTARLPLRMQQVALTWGGREAGDAGRSG